MITHFTKLLYHFYWSQGIKQLKQTIQSYVAMTCFICFMAWLLFYTCHISTMLPCFKVWEIYVVFICCTTIIHKHSNTKQTECANVAYVCFSDNGMMTWIMHMFMKWHAISRSQTPRVLQPSPLRKISSRDLESVPFSIESWMIFL